MKIRSTAVFTLILGVLTLGGCTTSPAHVEDVISSTRATELNKGTATAPSVGSKVVVNDPVIFTVNSPNNPGEFLAPPVGFTGFPPGEYEVSFPEITGKTVQAIWAVPLDVIQNSICFQTIEVTTSATDGKYHLKVYATGDVTKIGRMRLRVYAVIQ